MARISDAKQKRSEINTKSETNKLTKQKQTQPKRFLGENRHSSDHSSKTTKTKQRTEFRL